LSSQPVDRALIERTLASGIPLLRFPGPLERYFESSTGAERCRRLVARGLLAVVIYDLFLISDWRITPDVFAIAAVLRLGVVTPLALLLMVALWRNPPVWLRELIGASAAVLACGTTFGLMLLSEAPYRTAQHHAIILVVLFATIVQRLRFPYAALSAVICLGFQAVALWYIDYPYDPRLTTNMILAGAVVLSLIAAYTIERDARLVYLVALRDHRLNDELSDLSRRDALTGLANRRALDETAAELDSLATAGTEMAVLLFDVDHFKLYNDSLGHPAGDACLRRIADLMRTELREREDMVFRFGGEEFLVLLPRTGLSAAIVAGERVRRAVEAAAIPHPALSRPSSVVTVSAGAAAALLGHGVATAEIIAGADAALYAAKRGGRNQVWPPLLSVRQSEPAERRHQQAG
jgi:diguanylate cyclase (GGDEF)-like protein